MNIGECARLMGLVNDNLNGEYCEVLTEPHETTVPEHDGVSRTAVRQGIRLIRSGKTGYARIENLTPANCEVRSAEIHLTGWTTE